jgi:hypothetical protein
MGGGLRGRNQAKGQYKTCGRIFEVARSACLRSQMALLRIVK